jgi:hypothetical protein
MVKNARFLVAICIIAGISFIGLSSMSMAATYSGAWAAPTGNSFFNIELTPSATPNNSLYIYDWDSTSSMEVFKDGFYSNAIIYFTQEGANWYAAKSPGTKTLSLGNDNKFGFLFSKSGSFIYSYDHCCPNV